MSRVERHRAEAVDRAFAQIDSGLSLDMVLNQLYTTGASWGEQDAAAEMREEFQAERDDFARRGGGY